MKKPLLLFLFIALFTGLQAQTTYNVAVTNVQFTPPNLVINQGDIVEWTNMAGFHNVSGTFATYPGNAESFTSGAPSGAAWVYSKTFTVPGINQYYCEVHGFGMSGTVTVNGPLPVEMKYISATVQDGICKVEWKTDKEENLSHFTLQRSLNAVDFKDVIALNANHVPSVYSYMDDMGIDKFIYYRIKITDNNGNIKFSPVRLAQNDVKITKNTLTLMPNPYTDHFHISVQSVGDWEGLVSIYDLTGRVMLKMDHSFTEGNNYVHLDGSDQFPRGLYMVIVRNHNNKEFMSAPVVKQ